MSQQSQRKYQRIARAIDFISTHYQEPLSLEEIAHQVHLSASHFQRQFTVWVGVSPKKYLQYIRLEHAKRMLQDDTKPLLCTAHRVGLSGTGRLHDLFMGIEAMTPGQYKHGGQALEIYYSYGDTLFGEVLVASTKNGICHLAFIQDRVLCLDHLRARFPNAHYIPATLTSHQFIHELLNPTPTDQKGLRLHLHGTPFQLKVWQALLTIPKGSLVNYAKIAKALGMPKAARAVGSAVGANPIAFLIPCHRVILHNAALGGYRWGKNRKRALLAWEGALYAETDPLSSI